MNKTKDEIVQELISVVMDKKTQIEKAEKPQWLTNCVFTYDVKDSSKKINIKTVSDTVELVNIASFIITRKNAYTEANTMLGTNVEFMWYGYTLEEWITDLKTRINQIEVTERRRELENLESRLDKLISKEKREEMELLEIQRLLTQK